MSLEVSIALCTCNGVRYLPEQVRSICKQDLLPREIVLSDDASNDGSVEVVQQTLAQYGHGSDIELVVLRNANRLGVTRNFEQAVRACRHELVALSDQDDRWHPGRLRKMAEIFDREPDLLLLHSDANLVDASLEPLGRTLFEALEVGRHEREAIAQGRAFEALARRNLVTGATTVFRRRLLDVALPFPAEWLHDEWLAVMAAATGRMNVLDQPLIDYRQHGRNQIGARRQSLADKVAKALGSRGTKYEDRLRRAQALLDRLGQLRERVPETFIRMQREKVAHQHFRAQLPASRVMRIIPVLVELARGRYARFDRGLQAVVQDLLERG